VRLQAKFNLGIIVIFALLATGIAIAAINWVNHNTISDAERRVSLDIRVSWEIYNGKLAQLHSATEVLANKKMVRDLLRDPENDVLFQMVSQNLEITRRQQNMDILNLLDSDGRVLLRTRPPFHEGDVLSEDVTVQSVINGGNTNSGTVILSKERLEIEGEDLLERVLQFGGSPRGMMLVSTMPVLENEELIGAVQMGSLLNGATEEVDRIRDAVFENEQYKGKPLGTATIFMGDLRISTNVRNAQGERAVGTRVSQEVAERVLEQGRRWTGRAWVVDTWYLAQYDPIEDPSGNIIGMLYVGELEQKYLDMRTEALVLLLSVILAGMGLSLFVFFLITRGVLRPVKELSAATKSLADGNLSCRVIARTSDEVGDLARSFNVMAEQLEKHQQEIERQQQALEKLNRELEVTNRNYMEMLGFVTHELKNPLASATMSLHTVKDGYLGELNAAQERSLESVASSLDYFYDMIKNYLDLSRLEKGELNVHKTSVNLVAEVVEPILVGLARGLQEKEMRVENLIPSHLILEADRDLLRIVYDNLLSNAIKYGQQGGRVVLGAEQNESQVTLSVCNEGRGIPAEKIGMLFEKFSRLDGAEYDGKKGTGLGLYICKEIIEKHGGNIWVESEPGKWAKFSFTSPKERRTSDD
jgi:two-component system NtrC family sensor kinase